MSAMPRSSPRRNASTSAAVEAFSPMCQVPMPRRGIHFGKGFMSAWISLEWAPHCPHHYPTENRSMKKLLLAAGLALAMLANPAFAQKADTPADSKKAAADAKKA